MRKRVSNVPNLELGKVRLYLKYFHCNGGVRAGCNRESALAIRSARVSGVRHKGIFFYRELWKRKVKVLLAQSCPTLWDPIDLSPTRLHCPWNFPGKNIGADSYSFLQGWVAIPFSRGSSGPRDQTRASHIASRFFTVWANREALSES